MCLMSSGQFHHWPFSSECIGNRQRVLKTPCTRFADQQSSFLCLETISSSRGCGNCGKLGVLCRVFQALWEAWKTSGSFSTRFHSTAVSTAYRTKACFYVEA